MNKEKVGAVIAMAVIIYLSVLATKAQVALDDANDQLAKATKEKPIIKRQYAQWGFVVGCVGAQMGIYQIGEDAPVAPLIKQACYVTSKTFISHMKDQ